MTDPVEEMIRRDERADHFRARARGRRLLMIADAVVGELVADGLVSQRSMARRDVFGVLASSLYGPDASIDTPDFMNESSLEAFRKEA